MRSRMGLAALLLAAVAALLGDPRPPNALGAGSVEAVSKGEGRLHVVELARWIRDRREGLSLVDLRSEASFDDMHLPTATRRDLGELVAATRALRGTVVLYDDDGRRAAQAWLLLRGRTAAEVLYLDGGVAAWVAGLMTAELPLDATPDELAAWDEVRELSRYFGGIPRAGASREEGASPPWLRGGDAAERVATLVAAARRDGCGF